MGEELLGMAVQRRLAGMGYCRDRNGYPDESGPGSEETVWNLYPPEPERHGTLPGIRQQGVLAKGRRPQCQYRQTLCRPGADEVCRHGGICKVALLN